MRSQHDVLRALDVPDPTKGKSWSRRCPAHDDQNPSLSVSLGDKGGIVVKCWAGCATKDVVAAVGLTMADLAPPSVNGQGGVRGEVAAEYTEYGEGANQYTVQRFNPKGFRQVHRHANGELCYFPHSRCNVPKTIYRESEVRAAASAGGIPYVVEGEQDAETLRRHGLVATTNSGGAGSWQPRFAESFRGAAGAVIVADKDDKGYRHAEDVRRSLEAIGVPARVVEAAAGKDATDHFAAGFGIDDFRPVARETKDAANGFSLDSISASDLLVGDDDLTWLVTDVLAAGMPCMIGGPFKAFKTSVLVDLAVSLTNGVPFLDKFHVPNRVSVLFVSAESGRPTVRRTLRRIMAAKGLRDSDMKGLFFSFKCPKLTRPESLVAITDELDKTGAQVLILDPFYLMLDATTKAENLFSMGAAPGPVAQLCGDRGVTLILAHHFNRPGVRQTDPPTLIDLTMTGVAEYARQWMLLGWRATYDAPSRQAYLWLATGVAGWSGDLWELDITEGEPGCGPEDRFWQVDVRRPGDPSNDTRVADAVLYYLLAWHPEGRTPRMIEREATGAKGAPNVSPVCRRLAQDGLLEPLKVKGGNGHMYNGYRLTVAGQVEATHVKKEEKQ